MPKFLRVSRDANHIEIMNKLRENGYGVIDLAAVGNSVPDLIVSNGPNTVLVEVKMPKSQIYLAQLEFLAKWKGHAGFAETYEDAVDLVEKPQSVGLFDYERQIILDIVAEWRAKTKVAKDASTKPKIRIMEFDRQFESRCAAFNE